MYLADVRIGEAYYNEPWRGKFTVDSVDSDGTIHGHMHRGKKVEARPGDLRCTWKDHKQNQADRKASAQEWEDSTRQNATRLAMITDALAKAGITAGGWAGGREINLRLRTADADRLIELLTGDGEQQDAISGALGII